MKGLDTNVLVRFLVRDDEAQFARAERLIREISAAGDEARIDAIVLCELVWVLRSGYGRRRSEIATALEALLDAVPFAIDERDLVRQAAVRFRTGKGDFADYLIGPGDLDDDGIPDLVVGAPHSSWMYPWIPDLGAVYVFSGADLLAAMAP